MKNLTKASLLSLLVSGSFAVNAMGQESFRRDVFDARQSSQPSFREEVPQSGQKGYITEWRMVPNSHEKQQVITFLDKSGERGLMVVEGVGRSSSSDASIRKHYACRIVQQLKEEIIQVDALELEVAHLKEQEANGCDVTERRIATQRRAEQHREEMARLAELVANEGRGENETREQAEARRREGAPLIAESVRRMQQAAEREDPNRNAQRAQSMRDRNAQRAQTVSLQSVREEQAKLDKKVEESKKRLEEMSSSRVQEASVLPSVSNAHAYRGDGGPSTPMLPSLYSPMGGVAGLISSYPALASVYAASASQIGASPKYTEETGGQQPIMTQPDYSSFVSANHFNSGAPYGAPQQQNAYGAPQQQNPYGAPQQQNPYGAPQQQNPYGAPPSGQW